MAAVADITRHPSFSVLRDVVLEARETYFVNLAKGLAAQTDPVDQREIDHKRGFWLGALWALNRLPKDIAKDHEQFVADALKEAEAA